MRAGGEKRGNSTDRKRRKIWMLLSFGDGKFTLCVHCTKELDYDSVEADRIVPGGSYRHENVQPSCSPCNKSRSNNTAWVGPMARGATA